MKSKLIFSSLFHLGVRQKVVIILVVVLLTALSISSYMAFSHERQEALREINRHGSDLARFVSRSLTSSVVSYDYRAIQFLLDEVILSSDVGFARVKSRKGNIMAEAGVQPQHYAGDMVMFYEPVMLDDDEVGSLELGLTTQHIYARLDEKKYDLIQREALIIFLIAIGEFLALSFIIIRPVCQITESLDGNMNESGEIKSEVPVNTTDEFGYLAQSFNNLFSQLGRANRKLQTRVQLADKKLIESNKALKKQSEQLQEMSDRFEKLSITDALTGLYNRRHFEKELEASHALTRRHGDINSVIIMDIDFFKSINDQYGHPCGDAVLQQIANELQALIRTTDVLCRIGGEEFAIICNRTDKQAGIAVAEKLRQHLEVLGITYLDINLRVTISLGVSTINHESAMEDAYVLYRQADSAVYQSKQNGRNRSTHYDDLNNVAESA